MKILGQVISDGGYSTKNKYTGLLISCSEEESKEHGSKYIQHKSNLYKNSFCIILHNEYKEDYYHPDYVDKIGKKLGYKYARHVADKDPYLIKVLPLKYNKIRIL